MGDVDGNEHEVLKGAAGDDPAASHPLNSPCLNCGADLIGDYCHRCGQSGHVHRSLAGFVEEIAHGVLHFEGKLFATLPMLILRPGQLTRRYVDGERAKFVSPLALFLFSVFLMFAVSSLLGPVRSNLGADPVSREEIRQPVNLDINTGYAPFDDRFRSAIKNPDLLLYKIQASAYKFSWLLIPISLPLVWLLFAWKRRFGLYDHAVFIAFSLCFMTWLWVAGAVLSRVPLVRAVADVLILIPPIHMFAQLRGAYGLSARQALWRTAALLLFAVAALLVFLLVLIWLGIAE
jgi:hypothetical protein